MEMLRVTESLHGVRRIEVGDQKIDAGKPERLETVTDQIAAASIQIMPYPHKIFFAAPLKADRRFQREFDGMSNQLKEGYLNRRKWRVASS